MASNESNPYTKNSYTYAFFSHELEKDSSYTRFTVSVRQRYAHANVNDERVFAVEITVLHFGVGCTTWTCRIRLLIQRSKER